MYWVIKILTTFVTFAISRDGVPLDPEQNFIRGTLNKVEDEDTELRLDIFCFLGIPVLSMAAKEIISSF